MSDETNGTSQHQDQLTLSQIETINAEIAANQLMIGEEIPPSHLSPDYADNVNTGFQKGIAYLVQNYRSMRKVRGDGNCFYRAFLFGYLEGLLRLHAVEETKALAVTEHTRITGIVQNSLQELVEVGYPEFAIDTFHEEFLEILNILFDQSQEDLWKMFQEGGKADYLTWFLRVMTAAYLKKNAERYLPFVEGLYFDMHAYCAAEVEPMGKECEHLQISALTEYLGIAANIVYLDGRSFDEAAGLSVVKFQEDNPFHNAVCLLYRPGHYDVLYK